MGERIPALTFAHEGTGVLIERIGWVCLGAGKTGNFDPFEEVDLHHEGKRGGKTLRR
jgi:hypothetical protein